MTTKVAANQGPALIAVGATLLAFNVFFIGLRCYTSLAIAKRFNFNDLFMVVAVLVYASLLGLVIEGVKNGVGGHTSSATLYEIGQSLKYIFFLEIIYVILTSVMKASLAISLLQWAKKKLHIYLLYTAIVIDVVICLVVVFYFFLQCQPISYAWLFLDPTVKGTCWPMSGQILIGFALSGTTISLDMLFLFVPFFMLAGRGVSMRVKMYIYGIFGLGVLASVANFIRLASLVKLKASTDQLFDAAPVFLWSAVEVSIGISVAGIIELRPLMKKYNVKGFQDSFDEIENDRSPIVRLQSMDKSTISFPMEREMSREERGGRF